MRFSYSRTETYRQCPYRFKLAYLDGLAPVPDASADNALRLGSVLHRALETDADTAIGEFYAEFPIVSDEIITEAEKIRILAEKVKLAVPDGDHEVGIEVFTPIHFLGFADLVVDKGNGHVDIYDYKYTKNPRKYDGKQLSIYKHFYEIATGRIVDKLFYVFVPKNSDRIRTGETLTAYRDRVFMSVSESSITVKEVIYEEQAVKEFLKIAEEIEAADTYPKKRSPLCKWCPFKTFCESDESVTIDLEVDSMNLPKNERRENTGHVRQRIWLYGAPFSGKTYLANEFPDVLMLNTDGNVAFVDAPYIAIRDAVTTEGRITKRVPAWEVFKDTISELEKKQNDFKTVVVDLAEDCYEHCRQYVFAKMGIEHETDAGYGKGWDMVKTEFLTTMRRLMVLDYDAIILISHEDVSKEITKKSGDKITAIKPNMPDKIAFKLAGMMDLVGRVVSDGNDRKLTFKTDEFIFGGGRLNLHGVTEIPCTYEAVNSLFKAAEGKK